MENDKKEQNCEERLKYVMGEIEKMAEILSKYIDENDSSKTEES